MKLYKTFCGMTALICCASCGSGPEPEKELPHLSVSHPLRRDAELTGEYVGQIRAIRHIDLQALAHGYLEKIHVDEGQAVKEGQLMFEVLPSLYQAKLGKAQAEAQFAGVEYQNTERLANTKVVASSELALAKAKLDKAKAELALDQVELAFTQIKAPFDGIMGKFHVRPGSLIENGELLTTLSDNHEMWVYFNVPEAEYLQHKRIGMQVNSMQVRLVMADGSIYSHPGVVTAIEADFNNETGTIAYRATFPNSDGLLRHGQTGKVIVDETIKDALIVPQMAVFEVLDKKFVLALDDKNKVVSKEIKISAQMPDLFVVKEGIGEKDQILLEGQRKVNDGDYIVPEFKDPVQVASNVKVYAE